MPSTATGLTLTNPTCSVILANGAQAANVFWWTPGSVTRRLCDGRKYTGWHVYFVCVDRRNAERPGAGRDGRRQSTDWRSHNSGHPGGGAIGIPGACSQ
jgi:hypothetical protein